MKNTKNRQAFSNRQGSVNIKAGWNVINGVYNHQSVIDNSWYPIPDKETFLLETVSKWIVERIGSIGWFLGWSFAAAFGGWVSLKNFFEYLGEYRTPHVEVVGGVMRFGSWSNSDVLLEQVSSRHFLLWLSGFAIFVIWFFILASLAHRNDSRCPKCKKYYALEETWNSQEKETRTSKGYRVSQIRKYMCRSCGFEETRNESFYRNDSD